MVVLATGRSGPAVYEHVAALGLKTPLAAVCYNDAVGLEFAPAPKDAAAVREGRRVLFSSAIDEAAAQAVVDFAAAHGILVQYYAGDAIYVKCETEAHRALVRRYADVTGADHVHSDYESAFRDGPPVKMLLMTEDPDAVVALVRAGIAQGRLPDLAVIRGSPPFFVEILSTSVNKGNGLRRLCDLLAVPLEDTIAFGDGDNDLEFLQEAGLGIAMANARENVKKVADAVTDLPHDQNGIVHHLNQLQARGTLPRQQPHPELFFTTMN